MSDCALFFTAACSCLLSGHLLAVWGWGMLVYTMLGLMGLSACLQGLACSLLCMQQVCAVCCVLCAVCRVPCAVCCVLCAV